MSKIEHPDTPGSIYRALAARVAALEHRVSSAGLRAIVNDHTDHLSTIDQQIEDLYDKMPSGGGGVTQPPPPPPPPSGPVQIGGAGMILGYYNEGFYTNISRTGFTMTSAGDMYVLGSMTALTKYWNNDVPADVWIEIENVVASTKYRITGSTYNASRTASLRIDATLGVGTYYARWIMDLRSGNRVQITSGSLAVWRS